jgi:hypothetical protein
MGNAYAMIYGQCCKAMQSKLQSRIDFEERIKGNPIELLSAIQEHSMSYQDHQCKMNNIVDAIYNLMYYTARFKSAKDVMEVNIGGPIDLTKYVNMKIESVQLQ